jgi:hypothetical protein
MKEIINKYRQLFNFAEGQVGYYWFEDMAKEIIEQINNKQNENDVIALLKESITLLRKFVDENDCQFDHHGYCQEHGWADSNGCGNKQTINFLQKIDNKKIQWL